MDDGLFQIARDWFDRYVSEFYGEDAYVNENLRYKEIHCRCTCGQMIYLATHLDLPREYHTLARFLGLFHDVGRFEQFRRYRTYKDHDSVDHGELGVAVLQKVDWYHGLPATERDLIETAIRHHSRRTLPSDLSDMHRLFSRLIRDADKLDIFRIVTQKDRREGPQSRSPDLGVRFPDEPTCTPAVVAAVRAGRQVSYTQLHTLNDLRLMQLGWIYDLSTAPALRRVRGRCYLEKILGGLPDPALRIELQVQLHSEMDRRLSNPTGWVYPE